MKISQTSAMGQLTFQRPARNVRGRKTRIFVRRHITMAEKVVSSLAHIQASRSENLGCTQFGGLRPLFLR